MAQPSDLVHRKSPERLGVWQDPYDFSLILDGPLYQLLRRASLCGEALDLLGRRILVLSLVAWLLLLVLSLGTGQALGGSATVPFLWDVEVHVRFLLALPLLILAELVVHARMRPVVQQFLERHLVPEREQVWFEAVVVSALRWRNSIVAEWLRGGAAANEPLVGSGDIQSLADLANSFGVIRTMRVVPFTTETLVLLLVTILAPVLPLTLTMVPLEELLRPAARRVVLRRHG